MSPPTKCIAPSVLQHIANLSKLEDLQINRLPEDEELVCPLEMDDVACNLFFDLSVGHLLD